MSLSICQNLPAVVKKPFTTGESMNDHHSDCMTRYGGCCDCGFTELNRIQKYMDGQLIAPAPRGLTHRIAEAIEGRDSVIRELNADLTRYREMVSPANAIDLVEFIGPIKPCPFCGSVALERDGFEEHIVCKNCGASAPVGGWQFRAPVN